MGARHASKTWLARLIVGSSWLKLQGMLDLANRGIKKVHHRHRSITESLVGIHEDGHMPHKLRHGTNIGCSIKGSTQVATKRMIKGLHES